MSDDSTNPPTADDAISDVVPADAAAGADDGKQKALSSLKAIRKRSIEEIAAAHAADVKNQNSTLNKRHRKTGGDERGDPCVVIGFNWYKNDKKEGAKTGSDGAVLFTMDPVNLRTFDRIPAKSGAPKSDIQLQPLDRDKTYHLRDKTAFYLGGPTNFLGETFSIVPGQMWEAIGAKYEITEYRGGTNLRVLVHDLIPTRYAPYEMLARMSPRSKSLVGITSRLGSDPIASETRRLFGHDADHPSKYPVSVRRDRDGNVSDRKPDVMIAFQFVPIHEAKQIEETQKEYVVGILEPGLNLQKIGVVYAKNDNEEVTKRVFNPIRAGTTSQNAQRALIFNVVHTYDDYDNHVVQLRSQIHAESVGQFEVYDVEEWQMFAGTFYNGARGLMVGSVDDSEAKSAPEDEHQDESEEDEAIDAIKCKLRMYVDLAGTIRNVGVKCDPETIKTILPKIWKLTKYKGHSMGRTFETFENQKAKTKYSAIHRAGERATNIRSIRGDLSPAYEALKNGDLEIWAVAPHMFTHEELTAIQSIESHEERLAAYQDKSKYPHLNKDNFPNVEIDEVPLIYYLVVAQTCDADLVTLNGAVATAKKMSPFNPRFVGPYNEKADDEMSRLG